MIANPEKPWLDVHILHSATTPDAWWVACMDSVQTALTHADFPIALHVVEGEANHLGRSRARGYAQGNAPFVCQIDDDDAVFPNAFRQLRSALLGAVDAVFPQEMIQRVEATAEGFVTHPLSRGRQRHSMKVFRRDLLIDHAPWHWASDLAQLAALQADPALTLLDLPEPAYIWRVYTQSNSYPLRLRYPDELSMARRGPPFIFPAP